jgi:hypothetical protein
MQSDNYIYPKWSDNLLGIIAILGKITSSPVAQPVNPTQNHTYELNIQRGTASKFFLLSYRKYIEYQWL